MRCVLAVDLGGTKCRFGLVDEDLGVHQPRLVRTSQDRAALLTDIEEALRALTATRPAGLQPPSAIGIGAAGVMSSDGGTLLRAPNLPLNGFGLAEHLHRQLALPATMLNDGRASAWGEFLRGNAKGCDPLLVLFFGTGIGIGVILGGRPYRGSNNAAGEIGHTPWRPGGRRCPCGRLGCFEAYCGGGPMTARAAAEIGPPPSGGDRWTVGDIVAAAVEDRRAATILDEAREAAGAMVATLCTLLDPAAIVLGGGVLQGWPALRSAIEGFVFDWCHEAVTRDLRFVSSLGESDAILWGAAKATGVF